MTIDLRQGRYEDVLAGEAADTLISDPPYSKKTHAGHDATQGDDGADRRLITYAPWGEAEVDTFVGTWSDRVRGWFVVITDDVLAPTFASALRLAGRYVFAPLPLVETGSRVRIQGDGPSSWTCWIVVARPRTLEYSKWGTLPGSYVVPREKKLVIGGKPLSAMRALVRDYSRPGDLIVDPCAGGGTTLLAAKLEGRRALGAELDPATHAAALATLGYMPASTLSQPSLFDLSGDA